MAGPFARSLRTVSAVHVGILALVVAFPALCFRRPPREQVVPFAFMVEVPASESRQRDEAAPEPAPARPEPKPKDTIPEPASKPVKTPIAKSTTRVVRQGGAARRPTLSPEEIRRLLDLGATPGDRTIIPSEEQMCLEMIRRRFYESWAQPSAVEMGNSVVEVDIRLGPAGQVTGRRLVSGSGKPAVDASVMEAANAVSFIPGLTPAFLRRYPSVIVAFRLQ